MNIAVKNPIEQSDPLDTMARALFRPMSVDGVYARTALYEQVIDGLTGLISRHREPNTEILRFPPVMSRRQLEKSGYLKSFPHLLGCVSCLHGNEAQIRAAVEQFDAGGDWAPALAPADLVLSPAASDPFFGRGGKLMAVSQVEQSLKLELLIPVRSAEEPTACMSFNYHRDHFGTTWDLRNKADEVAHTGCVAFGIDRLALALFSTHGLDFARWPSSAREALD